MDWLNERWRPIAATEWTSSIHCNILTLGKYHVKLNFCFRKIHMVTWMVEFLSCSSKKLWITPFEIGQAYLANNRSASCEGETPLKYVSLLSEEMLIKNSVISFQKYISSSPIRCDLNLTWLCLFYRRHDLHDPSLSRQPTSVFSMRGVRGRL